MPLGDRPTTSGSQLIGSSVLDRQHYLLGPVTTTRARPNGQAALVVQLPVSPAEMGDLVVESHHITHIDLENNIVYTDLDVNVAVANQGKTIPLIAEKLTVHRQRRKVGEVVVRKLVETDWVQVPVYREKLVVTQVGQSEPLAVVSLGESRVMGDAAIADSNRPPSTLLGHWASIRDAIHTLDQLPPVDTATASGDKASAVAVTVELKNTSMVEPEPVTMEFASPQTAIQALTVLAIDWESRCQDIRIVHRDPKA
ncbi:MAG: DUF2382 domain-containing protein [Cyanobacteria bacterium J06638_6]